MTVGLPVICLSEEVKRPLLLHYFIYNKTIGALLHCKICPFATQNMPFYKPVCNQLKICRLQSRKSTVFFRFALHHGFKFVISFYYPSWVMFCMRIRHSIHYKYCVFILRFCMDCIGTYHALRFEYHVSYVRISCGFR